MENENKFWKENYIIAIDQNGKFESVPAKENEEEHWQLYSRLNKKLECIMGEIKPLDTEVGHYDNTSFDLPNKMAKLNYINIYPLCVLNFYKFVVIFPYKPTKKQLETLKTLYEQLSNPEYLAYYFEKPNDKFYLDYNLIKEGIENLKKFVKKKELLMEQDYQER